MTKDITNKSDTKVKILKEARALFAEKGFAAAGIDEIAKKTGIAKSVIYYYFKNKKAILDTMIEHFIDESLRFRQDRAKEISQANFEPVIDQMLVFLEERKEIIKIIFMQSVKQADKAPLFLVLDTFFNCIIPVDDSCSAAAREEMKVQEFYMFYIPLVNFIIFADKWCKTYQMQRAVVKEKFKKIIGSYIKEVYTPIVCR